MVGGESDVSLLLASGGVKSVDLLDLELVKSLASLLNHFLVGSFVNDEYKSVVVLNGLDGGLAAQGVLDDSELVESVVSLDGLQEDLGTSLLHGSLRQSEGGFGPDLGFLGGVSSLLHSG